MVARRATPQTNAEYRGQLVSLVIIISAGVEKRRDISVISQASSNQSLRSCCPKIRKRATPIFLPMTLLLPGKHFATTMVGWNRHANDSTARINCFTRRLLPTRESASTCKPVLRQWEMGAGSTSSLYLIPNQPRLSEAEGRRRQLFKLERQPVRIASLKCLCPRRSATWKG